MEFQFASPGYLLVALAIPLFWFFPRRLRNVAHGVARSLVILGLAIALANPVVVREDPTPYRVWVIDRSDSMPSAAANAIDQRLRDELEQADDPSNTIVIEYGSSSGSQPWGTPRDRIQQITVDGSQGSSPVSAALVRAAQSIPAGSVGSVTLMSDGLATDREWGDALTLLSARGIPLHTIRVESQRTDFAPTHVRLPETLRVGETVSAWLEGNAPSGSVAVTVSDEEGLLAEYTAIAENGRFIARLDFEPRRAGFRDLTFAIDPEINQDSNVTNNSLVRRVAVQDPTRVLYLGDRVEQAEQEIARLVGGGFEIKSVETIGDADLANNDLVFLDDRPADKLPEADQERLVNAVQEGGIGLFVSGGSASFGGGGYHRTTLEKILPVEFIQKEEKKDPSTALAVIIDTSGSMSGNRMVLAKEVTRLAIRRLLPHDKIGIVEFFGNKRWAAPLQSAANAIDIQRALNRLDAGGGTILMPAIEEAYYGLRNAQTRYKHVLVLTDAGVETGPYETLMRRMSRDGINVSTVLVGPERHSEFLVQLADWGKGRYYNASNRFNLPEIMLKQPSTALLPSYRPGSHSVESQGGVRWWKDIDRTAIPPLAGYVESKPRPGAEIPLRTATDRHPVVATWNYGLGRVTTFLSEPAGPGTEPWKHWDGYGPFLARLLERTRSNTRSPFRFWIERRGGTVDLWAERQSQARDDASEPQAVARFASAKSEPAEFVARAPGLYRARFEVALNDTLEFEAGSSPTELGPTDRFRCVSDAREHRFDETQVDTTRALDMDRASAVTGGVSQTWSDQARVEFSSNPVVSAGSFAGRSWASFAFLFALLAYLADLLLRRVDSRPNLRK